MSHDDFKSRAAMRRTKWAMEAFDAEGSLVASHGHSTELLRYAHSAEERVANLQALYQLCWMCFPEFSQGVRMNRQLVIVAKKQI